MNRRGVCALARLAKEEVLPAQGRCAGHDRARPGESGQNVDVGITLILTTAARVPAALAEFLRATILVANAARELRTALAKRTPRDDSALDEPPTPECRGLRTLVQTTSKTDNRGLPS